MKIAYCLYWLGAGGGVERVATSKVNWLVANGHEVVILTCDYDGRPVFYELDSRVRVLNAAIRYAEDFDKPLHKRLSCTLTRMKQHRSWMQEVLKRERFDIVVTTHMVETSFLPSIKDGSKKVLELHSSREIYQREKQPKRWSLRQLLVKCYEWRDRYIISLFDVVGCLTHEDYVLRGSPKNMVVIPNPLPFKHVVPSNFPRKKNVLAMGRMAKEKNFLELLDIWQVARHRYLDWTLRLVGHGDEKEAILDKIKQMNMADQVEICPFSTDVLPHYQSASIYVMTSLFEGMPMTLLEAQACGLPVVSYACPCGPRDVITDGEDGFLVPPGDRDLFVERLCQLMSDQELRQKMGRAAYTNVERFAEEHVMEQWQELFDRLLHS